MIPVGLNPTRPLSSITARLILGLFVLSALLASGAGLVIWGALNATAQMKQADLSLRQLERARAIEVAFNRYLLSEVTRYLTGGGDPGESLQAGAVRHALIAYRQGIGKDADADDDPDYSRRIQGEKVRISALGDLFEAIETEAMLNRMNAPTFATADAARHFVGQIAAGRDMTFRSVIYEVVADARAHNQTVFARLERLRKNMEKAGLGLAIVFLVVAVGLALVIQHSILRPVQVLAMTARDFGKGARGVRAPADLPGEFDTLATGFNQMAQAIETQQQHLETEVAARTEALAQANSELRRIDETRRQFFANVSHELRTPVTVLLGEAQLAARAEPDEMRAGLERIRASGGFLRRRLDDLMRLARSEDGALPLEIAPLDLGEVVAQTAQTARAYARANEITLKNNVVEQGYMIKGNAESLRQALLALIDNAIKFTGPGGEVSLWLEEDAQMCRLCVADTGPGLEGTDPDRLFDRYAQADLGRESGGSGLGLAIAKWIAGQHHGHLRTQRRKDGLPGAVFVLELPK